MLMWQMKERGMSGIAVKNIPGHTYVFLYFTEAVTEDGDDLQGKEPLGNRLYRYELVNNKLLNPKLLLDLPAMPEPIHNGGKITIGPDNNIYLVIGDTGGATKAQNYRDGSQVDGRSGILRITLDGGHVPDGGILGDGPPLSMYYAYGVRNSFGMDFDPVTGKLWDTENGENDNDEINLVEPGFNSGWSKMQGMVFSDSDSDSDSNGLDKDLENFNGKGEYGDPKFTWQYSVGPTDIKFLHSEKYSKQYENDLFVGDFHKGYLYHFDLNTKRTELSLNGLLNDRVADSFDELEEIIFAQGFGGITDLEIGPDGYIYILSLYVGGGNCDPKFPDTPCIQYNSTNMGTIFRIIPTVG
jgi:glucose/arabinose dehydrogenase